MTLAARVRGLAIAITPMPRGLRYRLRLRAPAAARHADAMADAVLPVLLVAVGFCAAAALAPRQPPGVARLWFVGAAIGLLTGVPFVAERRALRRRLAQMPPLDSPLDAVAASGDRHADAVQALAAGDPRRALSALGEVSTADPPDQAGLRLGALAAAASGDATTARRHALRAAQLDARRWEVLSETGIVLCRRGHFREGVRLLERATEAAPTALRAQLALAGGLAVAGRLREAVAVLDRLEGRRAPRRTPVS